MDPLTRFLIANPRSAIPNPFDPFLGLYVSLKGKRETTDYTEYTDLKRIAQEPSFTQQVNDSNLVTHSLSASICVHLRFYFSL